MGVLVPTYSISMEEIQKEWSTFRRALNKVDRVYFDRLFVLAGSHIQAGNAQGNPVPTETFFVSVLLEVLKKNHRLEERLDRLESELSRKRNTD